MGLQTPLSRKAFAVHIRQVLEAKGLILLFSLTQELSINFRVYQVAVPPASSADACGPKPQCPRPTFPSPTSHFPSFYSAPSTHPRRTLRVYKGNLVIKLPQVELHRLGHFRLFGPGPTGRFWPSSAFPFSLFRVCVCVCVCVCVFCFLLQSKPATAPPRQHLKTATRKQSVRPRDPRTPGVGVGTASPGPSAETRGTRGASVRPEASRRCQAAGGGAGAGGTRAGRFPAPRPAAARAASAACEGPGGGRAGRGGGAHPSSADSQALRPRLLRAQLGSAARGPGPAAGPRPAPSPGERGGGRREAGGGRREAGAGRGARPGAELRPLARPPLALRLPAGAAMEVYIPSFRYEESDLERGYTVFKIEVLMNGRKHFVEKRYSEFHALHKKLKKCIKTPEIPSKHVRNWVPKVLEQRRQGLETYLQAVILENEELPKLFLDFLNVRHLPSLPKAESCGSFDEPESEESSKLSHQPVLLFLRDPYVLPAASDFPNVVIEGVLHGIFYPHLQPRTHYPEDIGSPSGLLQAATGRKADQKNGRIWNKRDKSTRKPATSTRVSPAGNAAPSPPPPHPRP
uniref:Sorting nexin 2 n=2 Tax=Canis lupus familiaris TaxID=9615 RepID=A0A8C0RTE8_CANLF